MDASKKILSMMKENGITEYRLSKDADLPITTITNLRTRHTQPSIHTLETICDTFNISLSQFFLKEDEKLYPIEQKDLKIMDYYVQLDEGEKDLIRSMILHLHKK